MERGRCTKPELPAPGARAARGREAMSNGCGGGSPAPSAAWRTGWWREGARGAAGQGGQGSVYCCGLGNTSPFTGEAARRPEQNKSGRQWGGGGPTGGLEGEDAAPLASQDRRRRKRGKLITSFSVPYKSGACTFQKMRKTEKGRGGIFPLSYQRQEM